MKTFQSFRNIIIEAKDPREYDYEGDMAISQLKSIMRNAENMINMLEPNSNLPEWVQSKITLAEDYITTVNNYMADVMGDDDEDDEEYTDDELEDALKDD
tara:strand:+ start:120 stop:419 length:300 start_codon:yes stop_codon:yes gene_type:complete